MVIPAVTVLKVSGASETAARILFITDKSPNCYRVAVAGWFRACLSKVDSYDLFRPCRPVFGLYTQRSANVNAALQAATNVLSASRNFSHAQ